METFLQDARFSIRMLKKNRGFTLVAVDTLTRVCAWGLGTGLLIALAVTRFLRGSLFGIGATNATTFAASALLLTGAAIVASYIPARRAAKVDLAVALRYA